MDFTTYRITMHSRLLIYLKRYFVILLLVFILASCSIGYAESREETLEETIISIVNKELESTPSKIPPSATPTPKPTHTPGVTKTPTPTISTPEPEDTRQLTDYPIVGYGPSDFPADINPLTGLNVLDPDILNRRPISIKVSNYPRGIRPQWGLSQADQVFEYYHEAGLTRFNAIFYSKDGSQIGPIRSGRFTDIDLVGMYKAFFVYGSADIRVREALDNSNFSDRRVSLTDYPCPPTIKYPTCRIERETWNHLVTNTEMVHKHFDDKGIENERQNLDGFGFNTEFPINGLEGSDIRIRFSSGSYHKWSYDPASGSYIRYQDLTSADKGEETYELMVDRLNGQPISAENVVVILANYTYYSVDPEMVFIDFNEGGIAYGFRDGLAYPINWDLSTESKLIHLFIDDSNPYLLKPGNTWFILIGSSSTVETMEPDWQFQFTIP